MRILETINNVALAVIAAPEAIRELRVYAVESNARRCSEAKLASLNHDIDARDDMISELQHNLEAAESSSANLTELVARLEGELATLRAKPEPSIPEPDPGVGWELCAQEKASEANYLENGTWTGWRHPAHFAFDGDAKDYRYRRPIAKPVPQWVACTAEEASRNPGVSEWELSTGGWNSMENPPAYDCPRAYRTTAKLPPQIEMTQEQWDGLKGLLPPLHTRSGRSWINRAGVEVGTVLG